MAGIKKESRELEANILEAMADGKRYTPQDMSKLFGSCRKMTRISMERLAARREITLISDNRYHQHYVIGGEQPKEDKVYVQKPYVMPQVMLDQYARALAVREIPSRGGD